MISSQVSGLRLQDVAEDLDARVVDEDVELAEPARHSSRQAGDGALGAHIDAGGDTASPRPGDRPASPASGRSMSATTRAPSAARRRATARPMPEAAPVTTHTRPTNRSAPGRTAVELRQARRNLGGGRHLSIAPRSTGRATPVMLRASSLARKSAALATSIGSIQGTGIVFQRR